MSEQKVKVIVRSSAQQFKDHVIHCDGKATILQLKEIIKDTHVASPEPSQQRLIFCGKILKDSACITDSFKSAEDTPVVHLALKSLQQSPNETTNTASTAISTNQTTATAAAVSDGADAATTATANINQQPATTVFPSPQHYPTYVNHQSGAYWTPEQMTNYYASLNTAYQQSHQQQNAYANAQYWQDYQRYMHTYMQYMSTQHPGYATGLHHRVTPHQQQADQNDAGQLPPQQPQVPGNNNQQQNRPPLVGAGGGMDDEMGGEQDWLDGIFLVFRVLFVIGLVYLYSSVTRFIAISTFALLVYLYQRGFFVVQRRAPPRNNNAAQQQNNNGDADDDDTERNRRLSVAEGEENEQHNNNDDEGVQQNPPPPLPPSRLSTAWLFVRTFFTSLIPQAPAAA